MKDILKEIRNLSQHDKNRLFQCVFCARDPETCGCTEKDEDYKGFCVCYRSRREDGDTE